MRGGCRIAFALCGLLFAAGAGAASHTTDLATWTDRELTPYLRQQLTAHPRFSGETVAFVAFRDGAPATVSNELTLALRDRVADTVIGDPRITVGRHAGRGHDEDIDCTHDVTHYLIGLEVAAVAGSRHRVTLRVLDTQDRSWVTGTTLSWEGRLTTAQRRAFRQSRTDEYFRGTRDAPFAASQTDILAAHLAHALTCKLLQQTAGEYRISADVPADGARPLPGAIELVRNNLAANPALLLASQPSAANATLAGKAHLIVDDLYQYWVTVTPTAGTSTPLPTVSASTYVQLPGAPTVRPATSAPGTTPMPIATRTLLAPLRILEPPQRRACYGAANAARRTPLVPADHTIARGDCFVLQTRVEHDSTIFMLNYQVLHGLVRLSGRGCGRASAGVVARAGEALQFPPIGDTRPSASAWQGRTGPETFYVIAVTDRQAAVELAGIIDRLPARCTLSAGDGFTGTELEDWLDELGGTIDRWQHAIDWQAVRVQHVL